VAAPSVCGKSISFFWMKEKLENNKKYGIIKYVLLWGAMRRDFDFAAENRNHN